MIFSEEYYRDLIAKLGLPEMPIVKVTRKNPVAIDNIKLRADFISMVQRFVQFVAYNNLEQIAMAEMSMDDIYQMREGVVPENISVYIKVPVEYGGKLEFSNMFLIRTRPFRAVLDKFIDEQVLIFNKGRNISNVDDGFEMPPELFVPYPNGIVFIPALKGFAGAGGNATTDKMSEIGSTMFLKNDGRF